MQTSGGEVLLKPVSTKLAGTTGLEPATSAVTGQRSNQLSYVPPSKTGAQCVGTLQLIQ